MRVLVCGSRDFTQEKYLFDVLDELCKDPDSIVTIETIIEGCCPTGADNMAEKWARGRGVLLEHYPADWQTHGRKAGFIRNKMMLTDGKPDYVVAFYADVARPSKGTKNTVDTATKMAIPVILA